VKTAEEWYRWYVDATGWELQQREFEEAIVAARAEARAEALEEAALIAERDREPFFNMHSWRKRVGTAIRALKEKP